MWTDGSTAVPAVALTCVQMATLLCTRLPHSAAATLRVTFRLIIFILF
jgi:hypothetical protein